MVLSTTSIGCDKEVLGRQTRHHIKHVARFRRKTANEFADTRCIRKGFHQDGTCDEISKMNPHGLALKRCDFHFIIETDSICLCTVSNECSNSQVGNWDQCQSCQPWELHCREVLCCANLLFSVSFDPIDPTAVPGSSLKSTAIQPTSSQLSLHSLRSKPWQRLPKKTSLVHSWPCNFWR